MQASDRATRTGSRRLVGDIDPLWHGIPTAMARRFHQVCTARTAEVVSEFGLTPLQYGVMVHLAQITGEGIEQNVLADRINVDRNTASLLVEHLVKMGMVARQVNGADRRVRLLSLTAKGAKLYARLRPALSAVNDNILSPITRRERAGVNLVHVPYRDNPLPDLLAGQVDAYFVAMPSSIGFIRAGKLRVLAVTTAKRSQLLADIPTAGEFLPGYEASAWQGVGVPTNTSTEIIDMLDKQINAGLADAKMEASLVDLGAVPMPMTPDAFSKFIADETEKWTRVIKIANIRAD